MTTILAGGRPLTLLPEKAAFIAASAHAAGRRRAHRQGGELSRPRRAGAARHHQRDARRPVGAGAPHRRAADRLPRRLPALGAGRMRRPRSRRWRAWRAAHRSLDLVLVRGNHDDRAGDPPATLGIRVVDEPLARRTASPSATTRGRSPAVRAGRPPAPVRQRRSRLRTSCACRASSSAMRSACCRRSAPSPACTRCDAAPRTACSRSPTTWSRRCRWRASASPPEGRH